MKPIPRSDREKNLSKLVVLTTAIWVALVTAISGAKDLLVPRGNTGLGMFILCGGATISVLLLYFGREPLVRLLLKSVKVSTDEERRMRGVWHLHIRYPDTASDGSPKERIGDLVIERDVAGLAIRGERIRDRYTDATVVESWASEFAEVYDHKTHYVLMYAYKIRRPDNDRVFDKVGYVVADNKADSHKFTGHFVDIAITGGQGESLRRGTVVLEQSSWG